MGEIDQPRRNKSPLQAVERLRAQIAELRDGLRKVQAAQLRRATRSCERASRSPSSQPKARRGGVRSDKAGRISWATRNHQIGVFEQALSEGAPTITGRAGGEFLDLAPLLAWLFPDRLVERIDASI